MASTVKITSNNPNGQQVLNAVDQIRTGLSTLQKLQGLMSEAIGAGQASMVDVFGVEDVTQAQALADRWGNLMNVMFNSSNPDYNDYIILRDFLNATTYQ